VIGKKVKNLRRDGELPAVVYGHNIEPISISLDYREASKTLDAISPSALVVLEIDGDKHYTLVRDKQRNPVRRTIIHVDFKAVSLTETVRADVTINLIGEAPAIETYLLMWISLDWKRSVTACWSVIFRHQKVLKSSVIRMMLLW
jgi:large subunit ribosomal protein L25